MLGDRLVNIVVSYGTKMFGKLVSETSACLTDVEFKAFTAGYAVNDVRGSAREIMTDECYCSCYPYFSPLFFSDEGPLHETLEFFEISYSNYQLITFYLILRV